MNIASTLGGLAGACALTLMNEGAKKIDHDAPRLDLLGENALARLMTGNSVLPKTAGKIFPLAGDLITNSLYFGMARGNSDSNTFLRGALLGLTAGIGAIALPKPLGLETEPTSRTTKTKLMTIGWYLLGGLVAATVINALDNHPKPVKDADKIADATIDAGKTAVRESVKSVLHT